MNNGEYRFLNLHCRWKGRERIKKDNVFHRPLKISPARRENGRSNETNCVFFDCAPKKNADKIDSVIDSCRLGIFVSLNGAWKEENARRKTVAGVRDIAYHNHYASLAKWYRLTSAVACGHSSCISSIQWCCFRHCFPIQVDVRFRANPLFSSFRGISGKCREKLGKESVRPKASLCMTNSFLPVACSWGLASLRELLRKDRSTHCKRHIFVTSFFSSIPRIRAATTRTRSIPDFVEIDCIVWVYKGYIILYNYFIHIFPDLVATLHSYTSPRNKEMKRCVE